MKQFTTHAQLAITENSVKVKSSSKKVTKGVWGMPRLSEAKKDVINCEKLRGLVNTN